MKFVIGYAGISSAVYDETFKQWLHICSGDKNCEFVSYPFRPNRSGQQSYSESDANYFLREFARRFKQDDHNSLIDTGFALIYVNYDFPTTAKFVESFFPSVLTIPVLWNLDCSSKKRTAESKNNLVELLRRATRDAKSSIPIVKQEIMEHDSKTPLLLPVKNFESKYLVDELKNLQNILPSSQDKQVALDCVVQRIEQHHPRQKIGTSKKPCFVDSRKIEFHPPGSDRHAFARINKVHPDACLLSGRRRFGAPYDHAFHYDCIKGAGNLQGHFWGCHEEQSNRVGKPHLNIAPNDFVR